MSFPIDDKLEEFVAACRDVDDELEEIPRFVAACRDLDAKITEVVRERDEARDGYHTLDKNWEAHHDACMKAIREALGNSEATVPEIVMYIEQVIRQRDSAWAELASVYRGTGNDAALARIRKLLGHEDGDE